jgi:endonuclease YncB( thermonuclease family)
VRVLIALVVAFCAFVAPASAAMGPCVPGGDPDYGPLCNYWTGKATAVQDGDTFDVDLAGDGRRATRRIRLTGVNAMELSRYSHKAAQREGDCHGVEATARLEQLLKRGRMRVRLAAQDPASHARARLRRQVSVRIAGRWVDVGAKLLAEGHALWLSNEFEWAWNARYADLSRSAAHAGLRLWNPEGCDWGPAPEARISLEVNYDAPRNDRFNVNGEYVRIFNASAFPLALDGWYFRDSGLRRYTFQAGATVPAGGSLTLRMGYGTDTAEELHWGLDTPPFDNPSGDWRATGDGGYLFDPRGNLRAWAIYN